MFERPTPKKKLRKGNIYHEDGHIFPLQQNNNRVLLKSITKHKEKIYRKTSLH